MTEEEIKQARAVIEAATDGPWTVGVLIKCGPTDDYEVKEIRVPDPSDHHCTKGGILTDDDYDFIAASRTGWPAALDALDTACSDVDIARYERDEAYRENDQLKAAYTFKNKQHNDALTQVGRLKARIAELEGEVERLRDEMREIFEHGIACPETPSQHAQHEAAKLWCLPSTSHAEMVPELCMAFARVIDGHWDQTNHQRKRADELEKHLLHHCEYGVRYCRSYQLDREAGDE